MRETRRNEALVRIAKEAVLEISPSYYREYGEPEILHGRVGANLQSDADGRALPSERPQQRFTNEEFEKHRNRSFYTVTFFYDKTEEAFPAGYSSLVFIWGDTGKVFKMYFGGGGTGLGDLDEPGVREHWSRRERTEWQRLPPGTRRSISNIIRSDEVPPLSPRSQARIDSLAREGERFERERQEREERERREQNR
jgi:hypothetical protein